MANGVALSDAVAAADKALAETDIPSELSVEIGGSYEDQQETFGDLFLLLAMIIILVYVVMASQFESFMSPFVIMFSVPFAFVGVIMGLVISGTPLGVMGMIGILMTLFLNSLINVILYRLTELENLKAVLPTGGAVALVLISMALTLVAGLFPAGFAAKRNPVEALRSE